MRSKQEEQDAQKVQNSLSFLMNGQLPKALEILDEVVAQTPGDYVFQYKEDDKLYIKFWDQEHFLHYITWQKKDPQLVSEELVWLPNAYARAYYHLGFIMVKMKNYEKAIEYLEQGQSLEPHYPIFYNEKGHAYACLKHFSKSLAQYNEVKGIDAHTTASMYAMALRGKAFVYIELGKVEEAEVLLKESLQYDPESRVALNELMYIAHLRAGGESSGMETKETTGQNFNQCARCDMVMGEDGGVVFNYQGRLLFLCSPCEKKVNKKWWQFWK